MVENKRKIIKKISSIFIACVSALMLCISPFLPKFQPKTMIASADSVSDNYIYTSSNLYVPFDIFNISAPNYIYNLEAAADSLVQFTIYKDRFSLNFLSFFYSGASILSEANAVTDISFSSSQYTLNIPVLENVSSNNYLVLTSELSSSSFNANIYKIEFGHLSGADSLIRNFVRFFDINDNYVTFAFFIRDGSAGTGGSRLLENRFYYIENAFKENQEYKVGYDSGYNSGYSAGEVSGYNSGQNVGYNNGYNVGYQDGVNGANTYSFYNLISAVIDAPVQAFMGLFNFELLGVNLADFFLSMLTLSFIVTILRLLL